jgi:hypothetical protein
MFGKPSPAGLEPSTSTAAPVAEHRGVNVHAKQYVDGRDRRQLERLCRYITRPPIAQDRLERRADGRLELSFKRPWKDGTRAVVLEPDDLMVRLCAAVPPPRFHLVRYFGVLASHASKRREVVPEPPDDPSAHVPAPAPGDQLELVLDVQGDATDATRPTRKRWAWLLAHVFAAYLDTCPRCSGPMRWVQAATDRDAARELLTGACRRASASSERLPQELREERLAVEGAVSALANEYAHIQTTQASSSSGPSWQQRLQDIREEQRQLLAQWRARLDSASTALGGSSISFGASSGSVMKTSRPSSLDQSRYSSGSCKTPVDERVPRGRSGVADCSHHSRGPALARNGIPEPLYSIPVALRSPSSGSIFACCGTCRKLCLEA